MKKFKIIRNILIIVIIIIAAIYIFYIRNSNIKNSKTANIYNDLHMVSWFGNPGKATMQISCNNSQVKNFTLILATDEENQQEISYISAYHEDMNEEEEGAGIVSITTENGIKAYSIFPKMKKYRNIYTSQEGTNSYCQWIDKYVERLNECRYYTKGYEYINGKLLYYEKFKDAGLKFYFDKNELVYMKDSSIDESFGDQTKDIIYNVKITYDDSYKKFTNIPEDYTEYTVNEEGEIINL